MSDLSHFWWQAGDDGPNPGLIGNSLRFRGIANQYLRRTARTGAGATSGTLSFWVKKARMDTDPSYAPTIYAGEGPGYLTLVDFPGSNFTSTSQLNLYSQSGGRKGSNAGFRDPAAWYHVVIKITNANGSNGTATIYINGRQDSVTTGHQYINKFWGDGTAHPLTIGNYAGTGAGSALNGYLAEFHSVENQALDATHFGEFNDAGVWLPKKVSITDYGLNGFYLAFDDPANIGKDSSGKNNHFTATGFELTTTTSFDYDWMADSPTNNLPTFNALLLNRRTHSANLETGDTYQATVYTGAPLTSGKWYFEIDLIDSLDGQATQLGIVAADGPWGSDSGGVQVSSVKDWRTYAGNGKRVDPSGDYDYGVTWSNNHVVGCLLDLDAGTIAFSYDSTKHATAYSGLKGKAWLPMFLPGPRAKRTAINFGQRPFKHQPSGFEPVFTANLPAVAITKPSEHFTTILDSGANILGKAQAKFPKGLWIIKDRTGSSDTRIVNSMSGFNKMQMLPDVTAEAAYAAPSGNSVAWGWKAEEAWSDNAGDMAVSGFRNLDAGFSMGRWSGTRDTRSIAHGLNAVPEFVIIRARNNRQSWQTWHKAMGTSRVIYLDTPQSYISTSGEYTEVTSSYVKVGNSAGSNDSGTDNMMMYSWHSIPGYSAFGEYAGNGEVDGTFVYTGFRPALVWRKAIDHQDDWVLMDTSRDPYNPVTKWLATNMTFAEQTSNDTHIDILSNGFKCRSNNVKTNGNSTRYMYMCFAEHPFGGSNVSPAPAR